MIVRRGWQHAAVTVAADLLCFNCGSDNLTGIATVAIAAVTFLLVVATLVAAVASLRANRLRGYLEFFREYRKYEPDRRFVLRRLKYLDHHLGISELPDDARSQVVSVCHYLDHLGFLVDRRVIDLKDVDRLMGTSVLYCWEELEPFIVEERRSRAARRRPGEPSGVDDYAPYLDQPVERLRARRPSTRPGRP